MNSDLEGHQSSQVGRKIILFNYHSEVEISIEQFSGAPNDGFLSDPLKRYFRLSIWECLYSSVVSF